MTVTRPRRTPVLDRRRLGVLLHPSSLPGGGLKGTMGAHARRFVDVLAAAGASVWQVLPLGPPGDGSPYNSRSAHAGDVTLIDLEDLVERGWVAPAEAKAGMTDAAAQAGALEAGYQRFREHADPADHAAFQEFRAQHAAWLQDYCAYECIKAQYGAAPWWQWPAALKDRDPQALAVYAQPVSCEAVAFTQFVFFRQWRALRDYAAARGLRFFGDMPIFVAHDSADVWAHRDLFVLDADGRPEIVTGVPPDYFSAQGQRWGNPHYRWARMAADGFAWWRERVRTQRELFDWLRIDHFRGFAASWAIPASAPTAASGEWMPVPGDALLGALQDALGDLPLVAEDLGVITDDVTALRDRYELPGMRVLQFGFDGNPGNPHLPHNYVTNSVAYTGTHDNDTTVGWYGALSASERAIVRDYLPDAEADPAWSAMRAVIASVAALAVVPWQDVLSLGNGARMNTPGMIVGNWGFRFRWEDVATAIPARLARLAFLYGRIAQSSR
ncbi:4-alpha-glucanotransferase [Acidiferrobacter sp.]|uniref:4-alpha-glucanotransferase n=1 Tax=Acidiferrobacter sp. TaxID=1872107 RepID=UPI002604F6CE|nr:4-alpha-glucanotransferase [Acidiferrobacter sp.]